VFNRNPTTDAHPLDESIEILIQELAAAEAGSAEETALANSISTLMEARTADKIGAKKPTISPETWAAIAANLGGIILILGFEKANVLTSKGLSFIPKIKI
jgi:hypothetical protein